MPLLHQVNKFPLNIDIESTNACNLRCSMCCRDFMTEEVGYMDWTTFTKIFDSGIPYAVKLNWRGEPLLHKDLAEMVSYSKHIGVHEVALNTNALLLNASFSETLAKAGLDWLIISVDGVTKHTYEKIRQGSDFEKVVKNIIATRFLFDKKDYKTKIRIQICKQPANEHEIEEWKYFFSHYADVLRIGKLFDPQGRRGYKVDQPKSCTSLWQRIVVDWKGNIYPCCADYLGKLYLGNINDTTIYEAWHSKEMYEMRDNLHKYGRFNTPICENCASYC